MKTIPTIGICGSFPGVIGGTTILVQQMYDMFLKKNNFIVRKYDFNNKNHYFLISHFFPVLLTIQSLFKNNITLVCVSRRGFRWLFIATCIVSLVQRNKIIIFRYFGGDAKEIYGKFLEPIVSFLIGVSKFNSLVLAETVENISYFDQLGLRAYQLTNSRPEVGFQRKNSQNGKLKCVFVSQMKKSKGVFDVLQAVDGLKDVTVDFYGPLLWDVDKNDFYGVHNARYCGVVPLGEAAETISKYDVLLLPTRWAGESHAGVIIEAYSVGVPVIVYNWKALSEIVEHGQTGMLIPTGDVGALRSMLAELKNDPAKSNSLSDGSRAMFKEFFTVERSYCRIYEVILGELNRNITDAARLKKYILPNV